MIDAGTGAQDDSFVLVCTPLQRDAKLARQVLERAGLAVRTSATAEEACRQVSNEKTGVVILAEELLTSRALELLKEALAGQPAWSDLPIVLLMASHTGTVTSAVKQKRVQALGHAVLLERPLRSVALIAAVQSSLASRRRQYQIRDYITNLQETQTKLAHANADLQQFAFAASHDLQEPLRMVSVFTQLLVKRHIPADNEEAQQFAQFVRTGTSRLESLLRDLLHYSRAIHEEFVYPTHEFDLALAITDAISTLQVQISEANAEVIAGPMPVIRGDRTQLSLVFQNLFSNSIKYAKEGTAARVNIHAGTFDGQHLIRVQDNGIGFEQAYAERVFDLFQRLSATKTPGTGLGLAICRRIIERHGGRIWAESTPGVGSTLLFTLPMTTKAA